MKASRAVGVPLQGPVCPHCRKGKVVLIKRSGSMRMGSCDTCSRTFAVISGR